MNMNSKSLRVSTSKNTMSQFASSFREYVPCCMSTSPSNVSKTAVILIVPIRGRKNMSDKSARSEYIGDQCTR